MEEMKGKIVQVSGPVVDVAFEGNGELPAIKDALEVHTWTVKRSVMEVAQHIGNTTLFDALCLQSSEGLCKRHGSRSNRKWYNSSGRRKDTLGRLI